MLQCFVEYISVIHGINGKFLPFPHPQSIQGKVRKGTFCVLLKAGYTAKQFVGIQLLRHRFGDPPFFILRCATVNHGLPPLTLLSGIKGCQFPEPVIFFIIPRCQFCQKISFSCVTSQDLPGFWFFFFLVPDL